MNGRIIPETANRQDWPRLVAQGHRDHENRLKVLEKRVLAQSGAGSVTHTGTTAETVLATINIPALGKNASVSVDVLWTMNSGANNKTLRARLGGLSGFAFWSHTLTVQTSARGAGRAWNKDAANAQVSFSGPSYDSNSTAILTGAIDTSVAQTVVITGQLANSADNLKVEAYTVEVCPGE